MGVTVPRWISLTEEQMYEYLSSLFCPLDVRTLLPSFCLTKFHDAALQGAGSCLSSGWPSHSKGRIRSLYGWNTGTYTVADFVYDMQIAQQAAIDGFVCCDYNGKPQLC